MLKVVSKNGKVSLRGKDVSKKDIMNIILELIELSYTEFNIKYSVLMKRIADEYSKKLVRLAMESKGGDVKPKKRYRLSAISKAFLIGIFCIILGILIALIILGK